MAKTNQELLEELDEKGEAATIADMANEEESEELPVIDEPTRSEPKPEPQKVEVDIKVDQPVKDANWYAQERIKRREAARAAQAPQVPVVQPAPQAVVQTAQPDREPQYDGTPESHNRILEYRLNKQQERLDKYDQAFNQSQKEREDARILEGASEEYAGYEERYRRINPDYDAAVDLMKNKIFDSYATLHPHATQKQLVDATIRDFLIRAGNYQKDGLNPAEEFFYEAQERYGYQKEQANVVNLPPKTNNLKTIEANKKRSLSPMVGGGQGTAVGVTAAEFMAMSNADKLKLTPAEIDRLVKEG